MPTSSPSSILTLPASIRSLIVAQSGLQSAFPRLATAIPRVGQIQTTRNYVTESTTAPQSSVNATEVSHFNTLASEWWDPHGSSRLLHLMNPLRHQFINRCLATHGGENTTQQKYLDIGCGGGIFAESAARLASTASVTAVDPTPEVISVAKQHQRVDPLLLEPGRLTYRNIPIEELPLPNTPSEGFDIVSLFEVIEHIQQPSSFLPNILQHIKPGGWLIGSTIARTSVSWFTTKFMAEQVLRMVPRGTHEWSQYIQPTEMRSWATKEADLDAEGIGWQVMGVVYVPGLGWKEVKGSEGWGNYFFGVRKNTAT
ncbi:hypothetical protein B0A48_05337 [Cryoendolithus antarcticus]|uniref:Ubiquinone biosynthesis O-methyltransferase, mitochondrial n=1 Tax=Cryoendolithus antarcticus TaxID=1507870 RepID=A0A1V8TIM8_9PEZI|nr:hypothetical protein B0A48_05337 [Cryoendolithus antarcticus]